MSIQTETVLYSANGTNLRGHFAYDDSVEGERPGVIVVHEWWGLNEYIQSRAQQLAALGYCALAIDMFGDGSTADNPDDAGARMNAVLNDMQAGTARLKAGFETLHDHARVDGSRIAAVGYCFGGAMVLHMARIGMPLKAVVSFHGALGSFHKPAAGEVQAKVLVCHGAADEFVPQSDIDNFKAEMDAAGAKHEFIAYEGALHGFTSKAADENGKKYGLPLAYNEAADQGSWQAMQALFKEVF
ncbi:MAG: dienelactone hydrolase family protein [Gammaproteobacteria bacterium]|nr:dienelactone hydrolase family protein [Gammaproteobacteria bacterium]